MVPSAAPIAIMSNLARIVLTGVLCDLARQWPSLFNAETVEKFMHDMAGLLMMPIGLALLFVEMSLLSKLLISPPSSGPLVTGGVLAGEPIEVVMQPGLQRRRPG
jgi:exosortase/archaeosortase family protein